MNFQFSIAGRGDDPEIRKMVADCSMPGRLGVSFEREPDFFLGCTVTGHNHRVYIGRNTERGELAFLAVTANMPRYIEGSVKTIGYLGNLRVAENYQGRFLPLKAMKFLRENEINAGNDLCFSVVARENITPRRIFNEHARPSFPKSIPVGNIYTAGIAVGRKRKTRLSPLIIRKGTPALLNDIISFLNREGARKLLSPRYSREDFTDNGLTRGFKLEDMRLAFSGGEIIGTIGFWDQSAYKQSVVSSYDRSLQLFKPFYNTAAAFLGSFTGLHPLPKIGGNIVSAYAAFICIKDNDLSVFRPLLDSIYNLAAERGKHHLLVGLAENDPLLEGVKKYRHISYHSIIYLFSHRGELPENISGSNTLEIEIPYVEIASL
ncbi:MAG TPA: hypothetical protein DCO79_02155 [Spirochaeta sp.]|nr:hypothetical protein [Spirochaeta sp.]